MILIQEEINLLMEQNRQPRSRYTFMWTLDL